LGDDELKMAILYLLMGALFTFLAVNNMGETIWEPLTIVLLLVAAMDFLVAFQFIKKAMQRRHKE